MTTWSSLLLAYLLYFPLVDVQPGLELCAFPAALDFGAVAVGQRSTATVVLWNGGERCTLRTETDCECLGARVAKPILAPGCTAQMTVSVEPCSASGNLRRHVLIHTGRGVLHIPVVYRAVLPLAFEPATLSVGVLSDVPIEVTAVLHSRLHPTRLWSAGSDSPFISVELVDETASPGRPALVRLYVNPPVAPGPIRSRLDILTDDREQPVVSLSVWGETQPGLTASASVVDFGNVPVGTQANAELQLTNAP